jgi:hypothetical protein
MATKKAAAPKEAAPKAAAPKKTAAPKKPKEVGMAGGKLETFKASNPESVEKFKDALHAGKVGSMGHAGGQWEFLK